jgi:hypothetical protein
MKKGIWILAAGGLCLVLTLPFFSADEGMYPISVLFSLNLMDKGLEITPQEIFNPDGISLIDGIVQVGGCSGSFVSEKGLILTNHHCAYGATQAASTAEHDYIKEGFIAPSSSEEIEAKGMTARITDSYKDVSEKVLSAVEEGMGLAERTKAIEKRINEIVAGVEKDNPGKRAEVSEMFAGRTYVLFIYTYLRDIRLVYVPPRSIGEFGGETDNWMWPRHSGDFSFLRAYVAPDGSPADYSEKNIPYRPRKIIAVNPLGVEEGDFVFILGYPGRTYRHRTSHYLEYEETFRMPYVADWYDWQIRVMEKMGEGDRAVAIKHLSRIKGLSNTMKNYRGKLLGLKRLSLADRVRAEEAKLQSYIQADGERCREYGTVLEEIGRIYGEMRSSAERDLILTYLSGSVNMLQFAFRVYENSVERVKPDLERESAYMERNIDQTRRRLYLARRNYYEPTDRVILKELLRRAAALPEDQRILPLDDMTGISEDEQEAFLEKAFSSSRLAEDGILEEYFALSTEELEKIPDPFLKLAAVLYPEYLEQRELNKARRGALDPLQARLLEVKRLYLDQDFIPDANRTLRLTYGRIRGYHPADAVYYRPITTIRGVAEKSTGLEPFDTPRELLDLFKEGDRSRFFHKGLGSIPVCILYDMDTTGGNSGSPVLDSRGRLVGINFDRAYEATINDYAWSEDYSRSIAVDIRYVLWVTETYGKVTHLMEEMGVGK